MDDLFTDNQPRIYRFLLLRLCQDADLAGDLTQETLTRGWQLREQLRSPAALRTQSLQTTTRTNAKQYALALAEACVVAAIGVGTWFSLGLCVDGKNQN